MNPGEGLFSSRRTAHTVLTAVALASLMVVTGCGGKKAEHAQGATPSSNVPTESSETITTLTTAEEQADVTSQAQAAAVTFAKHILALYQAQNKSASLQFSQNGNADTVNDYIGATVAPALGGGNDAAYHLEAVIADNGQGEADPTRVQEVNIGEIIHKGIEVYELNLVNTATQGWSVKVYQPAKGYNTEDDYATGLPQGNGQLEPINSPLLAAFINQATVAFNEALADAPLDAPPGVDTLSMESPTIPGAPAQG